MDGALPDDKSDFHATINLKHTHHKWRTTVVFVTSTKRHICCNWNQAWKQTATWGIQRSTV